MRTPPEEFTPGQTVYNFDGQAGEYVAEHKGHHLVKPFYETFRGDDEGYETGPVAEWEKAFTRAPVPVLDSEITRRSAELDGICLKLQAARKERAEFDREEIARKQRITQHENLGFLDDFLAGKITHYFQENEYGNPDVVAAVDSTSGGSYRESKLRLLSLHAEKHRNSVVWKLNYYSDGSGSDTRVIPCRSKEEALGKLEEWTTRQFTEFLENGSAKRLDHAVEIAKSHGIPIPVEVSEMMRLREIHRAEAVVASRKLAYEEAMAEMGKLKESD